jgi:hypothetical protein
MRRTRPGTTLPPRPVSFFKVARFFLAFVLCAAFFLATERLGGPGLGWLGAVVFLLLGHAWRAHVWKGVQTERALGRERLLLNLRAAGVKSIPFVFPYRIRGALLVLAATTFLSVGLAADAVRIARVVAAALQPETPVMRVEFPAYTETPPLETLMASDPSDAPRVEVDRASYLEFFLRNKKSDTRWRVGVQEDPQKNAQTSVPASGQLGLSAGALVELLGAADAKGEGPRSLLVSLAHADGSKAHWLRLDVLPVPRPVVQLDPAGQTPGAASSAQGTTEGAETDEDARLRLRIRVDSRVPLSQVELRIRTKSGYRMNKTVGEFANAKELVFETDKAELSLLGIPFRAPDSLFVKAVAKTVVAGLEGESREIEFRVRTKQEARADIAKLLQEAKKELVEMKDVEASRENLRKTLEEVISKAPELGRRHPVARQIQEALANLPRMKAKGDEAALEVEKRIDAAIETLKREQSTDETSSLLARMQSLRNAVSKPQGERSPEETEALAKEAVSLSKEAEGLKEELSKLADGPSSGLSLEEKQDAQDLLSRDQSAQRLGQSGEALASGNQPEAAAQAQGALDEAQKGMGTVLQMMQAARQRAMRQAREKLTEADASLQNARERQGEGKEAREPLDAAGQSLQETPRLSREFDEAVNEARQQQRDASRLANRPGESGQHIDKAQDAVVKALAALQEEEQAEEQQRREQDGRSARAGLDALSAQGQLDVGWRKRILEEIARLKSAGETADSPVIRYLESRLR